MPFNRGKKRAVAREIIRISPEFFKELRRTILTNQIEYKVCPDLFHIRDSALIATLTLTGLRAAEVVLLKRDQFVEDPDLIRIYKVKTVKRGLLREKIPLASRGELGKFTEIIFNWIDQIPHRSCFVFPRGSYAGINFDEHLSRKSVYRITRKITGKYPHYFRSVCATIYGKIFDNDPYLLKDFMGWKNLNSSTPYVKRQWENYEQKVNSVF